MTIRDIQHHLASTIGTELYPEAISNITHAVLGDIYAWLSRPLWALYTVVFMDALVVKGNESNAVRNKAHRFANCVDTPGIKHDLVVWGQVCAELGDQGVRDIIIACVDGLTGFAEVI